MSNLSFTDFKELLELNLDKKYISECLTTIESSDCLFHPGTIMPHDQVTSLYDMRLKIAKGSSSFDDEQLQDFESIVSNLKNADSKEVGIATLYIDNISCIFFYGPEVKNILGVLKTVNPKGIQGMEEYATQATMREMSVGFQKYSSGVFVRDWK